MDSRFVRLSCMSGSGSTRGSGESEEESSSDTDNTVSTEQSMGNAEVVTGSVCEVFNGCRLN